MGQHGGYPRFYLNDPILPFKFKVSTRNPYIPDFSLDFNVRPKSASPTFRIEGFIVSIFVIHIDARNTLGYLLARSKGYVVENAQCADA